MRGNTGDQRLAWRALWSTNRCMHGGPAVRERRCQEKHVARLVPGRSSREGTACRRQHPSPQTHREGGRACQCSDSDRPNARLLCRSHIAVIHHLFLEERTRACWRDRILLHGLTLACARPIMPKCKYERTTNISVSKQDVLALLHDPKRFLIAGGNTIESSIHYDSETDRWHGAWALLWKGGEHRRLLGEAPLTPSL